MKYIIILIHCTHIAAYCFIVIEQPKNVQKIRGNECYEIQIASKTFRQ